MSRPSAPIPSPADMVLAPPPGGIVTPNTVGGGALPNLRTEAALAPALGMAALGRGISQVGAVAAEIAMVDAKDQQIIAEAETNTLRAEAEHDIRAAIDAEPDEARFGALTENIITSTLTRLDKVRIPAGMRELIEAKNRLWSDGMRREADRHTKTVRHRKAGIAVTTEMKLYQEQGRSDLFEQRNQWLTANRHQTIEQQQLNSLAFERRQKEIVEEKDNELQRDAIEQFTAVANNSPDAAAQLLDDTSFTALLKPTTVASLKNRLQGAQRDVFAAAQADAFDAIVSGKDSQGQPVLTPKDVERVAGNRVRPHELKKLQDTLTDFQLESRKAEMAKPEKQRELFGELLDRAWKFDREALGGVNSKAARDEYADILGKAKWLDEVLRGEVSRPLAAKWFATSPKLEGNVKEYLDASVKDLFDAGRFGQTKKKVPKVEGDEGFVAWEQKFKEVPDEGGLKKARANMADVQIALTAWEKENPKATRIEATGALYRIAGSVLGGDDAAAILEGANRKTQPFDPASIRRRLQPAGAQGEIGDAGAAGYSGELVDMVKGFEGFSAKAFGDFKQTSIGYGTRAKHEGEVLTEEQADARLREELNMHTRGVDAAIKAGGYKLTEKQREALISFDFNTGRAVHLLETADGDLREIERRMRLYTKAGGVEQGGLVKRRKKEADIFAADIR